MNLASRSKRPRRLFLIIAGACVSAILLYVVFFTLANDTWVVISTPSAPWGTEGPVHLFEARLWAIMLGAFAAGAGVTIFLWLLVARRRSDLSSRVQRLEKELDKTKRLLAVSTQKSNDGAGPP